MSPLTNPGRFRTGILMLRGVHLVRGPQQPLFLYVC